MVFAIIVAAGKGKRMRNETPKQYLPLAGRPVLSYSLLGLCACPLIDQIVLVIPENDFDYCRKHILNPLSLQKPVKLVPGGKVRQDSVRNGLLAVEPEDNRRNSVVIHDGVRPFIHPKQLESCIIDASDTGACILGLPASETLKRVNSSGMVEKTLTRNAVWYAQTPQAFSYRLIRRVHITAWKKGITSTDDAALVEQLGETDVAVIEGSRFNIKITTQEDLMLAEAIMASGALHPSWTKVR